MIMLEVTIHQAQTQLSELLRLVAEGEEVIIASSGTPVARLVPIQTPAQRLIGVDQGLYEVPEDFDAPLSEEVLAGFER